MVYVYTFGIHCIVCYSIYGFWLHLWYLQTFGHCIVVPSIYGWCLHLWYPLYCLLFNLRFLFTPLVSSNFWPLYCLPFDLRFISTPLVSIVLSVIQFTVSDYTFVIFKLLAIVLSVLRFTVCVLESMLNKKTTLMCTKEKMIN
jgi:hypothetical protein